MKSQVLHAVWCNISGEAAGEIWHWSLLGVKGFLKHLCWQVEFKETSSFWKNTRELPCALLIDFKFLLQPQQQEDDYTINILTMSLKHFSSKGWENVRCSDVVLARSHSIIHFVIGQASIDNSLSSISWKSYPMKIKYQYLQYHWNTHNLEMQIQ